MPTSTRAFGSSRVARDRGDEAIRDPLSEPARTDRAAPGSLAHPYFGVRVSEQGHRRRSDADGPRHPVIAKALLGAHIGTLPAGRHRELKRALGYALDWPELKVL